MDGPEYYYSLVIPVYNEEESLKILFREILEVMTPLIELSSRHKNLKSLTTIDHASERFAEGLSGVGKENLNNRLYEIIFINDCSSDCSAVIIEEFSKNLPEIVQPIHLTRRRGQTFALKAGLRAARGKIVITLDSDLQNDPRDILKLLAKMEQGYDCVSGWRKARQDHFLKTFLSKLGNALQRLLTGTDIYDISCTLRAYKRTCVDKIPLNWEGQHRFIPLCLFLQGFKVGEVQTHHRKRQFGYSKYGYKRIFRVVLDFFRIILAKGKE